MKSFNQWLSQASPAIQELPEVAVRAIFEAGQENPELNRMQKFTANVLAVNKTFAQYYTTAIWEQSK